MRHHFYSFPHALARHEVEVRLTATTVEIFHRGWRVALDVRSHRKGGYTKSPDHMPAAHRAHREWSPSRLVAWDATVGSETAAFIEQLLDPEAGP